MSVQKLIIDSRESSNLYEYVESEAHRLVIMTEKQWLEVGDYAFDEMFSARLSCICNNNVEFVCILEYFTFCYCFFYVWSALWWLNFGFFEGCLLSREVITISNNTHVQISI